MGLVQDLLGKESKHTLNWVAWHGSPSDDSPKSYTGMQQNKLANLSWPTIGQHKTTLSASGVTNDQPPLHLKQPPSSVITQAFTHAQKHAEINIHTTNRRSAERQNNLIKHLTH